MISLVAWVPAATEPVFVWMARIWSATFSVASRAQRTLPAGHRSI